MTMLNHIVAVLGVIVSGLGFVALLFFLLITRLNRRYDNALRSSSVLRADDHWSWERSNGRARWTGPSDHVDR